MVYTHQIGVLMANYGKPGMKFVIFLHMFSMVSPIFFPTNPWHPMACDFWEEHIAMVSPLHVVERYRVAIPRGLGSS